MSWLYVFLAGIIEIFWVLGLKEANTPLEIAGVVFLIVCSFYVLAKAFEHLPVSIVYAVFTGMGTMGIVVVESIFLGEPISWIKCLFVGAILCGVVGLKITTKENTSADSTLGGEH